MHLLLKHSISLFAFLFLILSIPQAFSEPSKEVPKGGTINLAMNLEPVTLHPVNSTDTYAFDIHSWTIDNLLVRNMETYEWNPRLAKSYEISKDNKTFTFHLNEKAVFHDGTPVLAEDVKFSFECLFDPKYHAQHRSVYFEGIEKAVIINEHTIQFIAKDKYFKNFESLASGLNIIPKHVYADPEKLNSKIVIGSGPYFMETYDRGQKIVLKRFDKWYGWGLAENKNQNNFDRIVYKFVKDENSQIEMLKKGELDFLTLTSEAFHKKTEGDPFGSKITKVKTKNKMTKDFAFYGPNLRNPLFKDKNVRLALAHLVNRKLWNEKFRFKQSLLATGPWYQQSDYASKKVNPIPYDPKKALELLKQSGWSDSDKNGILDKKIDNKLTEFKFTLFYTGKDVEKYNTIFKEDLKKIGIEMDLKLLEWSTFIKLIDAPNSYEMFQMGWADGDIDLDPKQLWHSSSTIKGGANRVGYMNPEVDKLIDEGRLENNRDKRISIFQKVYEKIAADVPFIFWFNNQYDFYAVNKRIQRPKDTYPYNLGVATWWIEK